MAKIVQNRTKSLKVPKTGPNAPMPQMPMPHYASFDRFLDSQVQNRLKNYPFIKNNKKKKKKKISNSGAKLGIVRFI
jgi:hypothetical protein